MRVLRRLAAGLENVKTWGFRGGFNHNWDPYWNTGIYGAYAAVNYGNIGDGSPSAPTPAVRLLGAWLAPATRTSTSLRSGIITRWTPVKNLTFSGEFAWTRLDQKNSGTVAFSEPSRRSPSRPLCTS